jgi:membrane protease subunit HflK
LQDAQPPEQVQSAFADVVKAREDRQRLINEAEAYSNDIIPRARGQAARLVEEASAYREQVVVRSEGDASRFGNILTQYKLAPEVTRQRMYLDAVETVLGSSSKIMVSSKASNQMIYLPLDKWMTEDSATARRPMVSANDASPVTNSVPTVSPSLRDNLRSREVR